MKFSDITNRKLVETLFYLRRRHERLIPDMSEAIQRFRIESAMTSDNSMTAEGIQYLLDRLFTTKISLALLTSVYDAVHCRNKQALETLVTRRCDVMKIIEEAHDRASTVCETSYMEFADLELRGRNVRNPVKEVEISCVPSHLQYIMFELMKNAMQATVVSSLRLRQEVPAIQVLGNR